MPKRVPNPKRVYKLPVLPPDFHPTWASVNQVAAYLVVSRKTVLKFIAEGHYETFKIGAVFKIRFDSVLADIERLKRIGAAPAKKKPGGQRGPRKGQPQAVAAE